MSFDEQLRQAFETLTDRLRDDIARHVRAVVDELSSAAQADRERAAEETGRAVDAAARTASDTARVAADAAAAGVRADMRSADLSARERLLAAVRAMDRARSLTEIFDALSVGAGREAVRAAVLLVRDTTLRGWRFTGFNRSLDASHDIELALQHSGVIGEAIKTLVAASTESADPAPSPPFDLPNGRTRIALPIAIGGQVVAVLYADEGPEDNPRRGAAAGWAAAVEILARHAARSLEALTAFKAAATLTERTGNQPISIETGDRYSDADEAARRYARLLVSEIKMYQEDDIAAGRRERDLAIRLGGEIQRARALYEERVPAQVRLRTDFFQAELVRTLADGDPSLLEAKS